MFKHLIERAEIVIEALPYIQKFHGKTIVIKYGGSAMALKKLKRKVIQDIILMKYVGMNPVLVHGGGRAISKALRKEGIESEFIDGLRVTSKEAISVVKDVLVNRVARNIAQMINKVGGEATVLTRRKKALLRAKKIYLRRKREKIDLGFTGAVTSVDVDMIDEASEKGYIPIISSIGIDRYGQELNINADQAASAVAAKMGAAKLILLTDVRGVTSKRGELISRISPKDARRLIRNKTISGGMLPKIKCCLEALKAGVEKAHIINGKIPHALLLELFTDYGIGTMVEA